MEAIPPAAAFAGHVNLPVRTHPESVAVRALEATNSLPTGQYGSSRDESVDVTEWLRDQLKRYPALKGKDWIFRLQPDELQALVATDSKALMAGLTTLLERHGSRVNLNGRTQLAQQLASGLKRRMQGMKPPPELTSASIAQRLHRAAGGKGPLAEWQALFERLLHFGVYDLETLSSRVDDLQALLRGGAPAADGWSPQRRMDLYRLAVLVNLQDRLRSAGLRLEAFGFEPGRHFTHSDEIHPRFSLGYSVEEHQLYTKIGIHDVAAFQADPATAFPRRGASVLHLAGGNGRFLERLAEFFEDSRLALVEAYPPNVASAVRRFETLPPGNRYETRLADARFGFDGIPYPDGSFDVVFLVGESEFAMGTDDITRLLTEALRVLKVPGGRLVIETPHFDMKISEALSEAARRTGRLLRMEHGNSDVHVISVENSFETPDGELVRLMPVRRRISATPGVDYEIQRRGGAVQEFPIDYEVAVPVAFRSRAPEFFFSAADFIRQWYYNPRWGYYAAGKIRFGADYETVPMQLEPHFGAMIAEQARHMWTGMRRSGSLGADEAFEIIELAAGTGAMARGLLQHVRQRAASENPSDAAQPLSWTAFQKQLRYVMAEINPVACEQLREDPVLSPFTRNEKARVVERDVLEFLRGLGANHKGLVLSNELFDNIPHHHVRFRQGLAPEAAWLLPVFTPEAISLLRGRGLWPENAPRLRVHGPETIAIPKEAALAIRDRLEEPAYRDLKEALRGKIQMAATYRPADELPDVKRYLELNHKFIEAALETHGGEGQFFISPAHIELMEAIGHALESGYVITIDYMRGIEDTLDPNNRQMTFFYDPNRPIDWRSDWGDLDITFSPNVTNLEKAAEHTGMRTIYFGQQRALEQGTGISMRSNVVRQSVIRRLDEISIGRLRDQASDAMGSLFDAILGNRSLGYELTADLIRAFSDRPEAAAAMIELMPRRWPGQIFDLAILNKLATGIHQTALDAVDDQIGNFYHSQFNVLVQQKAGTDDAYRFPATDDSDPGQQTVATTQVSERIRLNILQPLHEWLARKKNQARGWRSGLWGLGWVVTHPVYSAPAIETLGLAAALHWGRSIFSLTDLSNPAQWVSMAFLIAGIGLAFSLLHLIEYLFPEEFQDKRFTLWQKIWMRWLAGGLLTLPLLVPGLGGWLLSFAPHSTVNAGIRHRGWKLPMFSFLGYSGPAALEASVPGHYVTRLVVLERASGKMKPLRFVRADHLEGQARDLAVQSLDRWHPTQSWSRVSDLAHALRNGIHETAKGEVELSRFGLAISEEKGEVEGYVEWSLNPHGISRVHVRPENASGEKLEGVGPELFSAGLQRLLFQDAGMDQPFVMFETLSSGHKLIHRHLPETRWGEGLNVLLTQAEAHAWIEAQRTQVDGLIQQHGLVDTTAPAMIHLPNAPGNQHNLVVFAGGIGIVRAQTPSAAGDLPGHYADRIYALDLARQKLVAYRLTRAEDLTNAEIVKARAGLKPWRTDPQVAFRQRLIDLGIALYAGLKLRPVLVRDPTLLRDTRLVLSEDGNIVAFFWVSHETSAANYFEIRPIYRGLGIGSEVLAAACLELLDRGRPGPILIPRVLSSPFDEHDLLRILRSLGLPAGEPDTDDGSFVLKNADEDNNVRLSLDEARALVETQRRRVLERAAATVATDNVVTRPDASARISDAELTKNPADRKDQIKRLLAYARRHATVSGSDGAVELIMAAHESRQDSQYTFDNVLGRIAQEKSPRSVTLWLEDGFLHGMPETVDGLQKLTDVIQEFDGVNWRHELTQPSLRPEVRDALEKLADVWSIRITEADLSHMSNSFHADLAILADILREEGWTVNIRFERLPIDAYLCDLQKSLSRESSDEDPGQALAAIRRERQLFYRSALIRDEVLAGEIADSHHAEPNALQIVTRGTIHTPSLSSQLMQRNLTSHVVRQPFSESLVETFRNGIVSALNDWFLISGIPDPLRSSLSNWAMQLGISNDEWDFIDKMDGETFERVEYGIKIWLWLKYEVLKREPLAVPLVDEISAAIENALQALLELETYGDAADPEIQQMLGWMRRFQVLEGDASPAAPAEKFAFRSGDTQEDFRHGAEAAIVAHQGQVEGKLENETLIGGVVDRQSGRPVELRYWPAERVPLPELAHFLDEIESWPQPESQAERTYRALFINGFRGNWAAGEKKIVNVPSGVGFAVSEHGVEGYVKFHSKSAGIYWIEAKPQNQVAWRHSHPAEPGLVGVGSGLLATVMSGILDQGAQEVAWKNVTSEELAESGFKMTGVRPDLGEDLILSKEVAAGYIRRRTASKKSEGRTVRLRAPRPADERPLEMRIRRFKRVLSPKKGSSENTPSVVSATPRITAPAVRSTREVGFLRNRLQTSSDPVEIARAVEILRETLAPNDLKALVPRLLDLAVAYANQTSGLATPEERNATELCRQIVLTFEAAAADRAMAQLMLQTRNPDISHWGASILGRLKAVDTLKQLSSNDRVDPLAKAEAIFTLRGLKRVGATIGIEGAAHSEEIHVFSLVLGEIVRVLCEQIPGVKERLFIDFNATSPRQFRVGVRFVFQTTGAVLDPLKLGYWPLLNVAQGARILISTSPPPSPETGNVDRMSRRAA